MQARLIRHGKTQGNAERRYIGRTDEPLSPAGREELLKMAPDPAVKRVFVSPYLRARETASILFPNAEQCVLPGLRETDFGDFEGKTADEMAEDPAYRAWVDGMCLGRCPGGESREDVTKRAVEAFTEAVRSVRKEKREPETGSEETDETVVFVTHGGVIMSILEALAVPHRDYYDYYVPNLGGWLADCAEEDGQLVLRDARSLPPPGEGGAGGAG